MNDKGLEIYDLLLRGRNSDAIEALHGDTGLPSPMRMALLALGTALQREFAEARQMLEGLGQAELNSEAAAISLEARALVADAIHSTDAQDLAEKAVESQPGSVFANRLLAKIKESKGMREEALEHYRQALDHFPESQRTLLDIVKVLITLKRPQEARELIKQAELSFRREVLKLALGRRGPYGFALAVSSVALMLVNQTHVFALLILGTLALIMLYIAIREQDGVILSMAFWFTIIILLSEGLRWILPKLGALEAAAP